MFKNHVKLIMFLSVFLSVNSYLYAHSGAYVADSAGQAVRDGFGRCIKSDNGVYVKACYPQEMPVSATVSPPEPKPIVVQEVVEETISLSGDALFATNSDKLTEAGKASISEIVKKLERLSSYRVSLHGHADSRGKYDYNMKLSERRAQAVADYLIDNSVPASAISVYGHGESEPIASNDTTEGRAKNRRVDISVGGIKS